MNTTETNHKLLASLKYLDMDVEILTNSSQEYRRTASDAWDDETKAVLNWVSNVEEARLRDAVYERRSILRANPELIEEGLYEPRPNAGLTKLGAGLEKLRRADCLKIMRYVIEGELRARKFFLMKADSVADPALRSFYEQAVKSQEDHIDYLGNQRIALMQYQVNQSVVELAGAVA